MSFHDHSTSVQSHPTTRDAEAIVHPAGSPPVGPLVQELGSLVPAERQTSGCVIEVVPEGVFLTYGLGVPLRRLRDPAAASAHVPVRHEASI